MKYSFKRWIRFENEFIITLLKNEVKMKCFDWNEHVLCKSLYGQILYGFNKNMALTFSNKKMYSLNNQKLYGIIDYKVFSTDKSENLHKNSYFFKICPN